MKLPAVIAFVVFGMLVAVGLGAAPASAVGGLAGRGNISVPNCPPDFGLIVGRNIMGNVWRIDYGFGCSNPKFAYIGAFSPSEGGCLPYFLGGTGFFCMGGAPTIGVPTPVALQLCFEAEVCVDGSGDVVQLSA